MAGQTKAKTKTNPTPPAPEVNTKDTAEVDKVKIAIEKLQAEVGGISYQLIMKREELEQLEKLFENKKAQLGALQNL